MVKLLLRCCIVFGIALAAHAMPMGAEDARHLLLRTSFAASPADVRALAGLTRAEAVDRLLAQAVTEPLTRPGAELDHWTPRSQLRSLSESERREWLRQTVLHGQ
jgi:hypothetical protein